jgi:hypothetical protein
MSKISYEFKKYETTPDNLKKTLNKYGVAIIPNVINELDCNNMVNEIWDYFESITKSSSNKILRNDKDSWRNFYNLYPMHSMLFQHFSVGHCQASWNLRQNPKIVNIFSKFWNVEPKDLLVSFDGLSFNPPPEETNRGWNRNNTWFHSDQSFQRNDFECVQSWITALDVEEGDATLAFYEKSHKYHKDFKEMYSIESKNDWYKLNKEEEKFFLEKGCKIKKIMCPKGSLVLWDSRTIHCGTEALKGRKNKKWRAVIYLCYQPKKISNDVQIKKKQKAFNELRTTSHWPSKIKLFPKTPRTYGNTLPTIDEIEEPILNDIGKSLAGFDL